MGPYPRDYYAQWPPLGQRQVTVQSWKGGGDGRGGPKGCPPLSKGSGAKGGKSKGNGKGVQWQQQGGKGSWPDYPQLGAWMPPPRGEDKPDPAPPKAAKPPQAWLEFVHGIKGLPPLDAYRLSGMFAKGKDYILKVGTVKEPVRIEEITSVMDASDLSSAHQKDNIEYHDVAECILSCQHAIAFDIIEEVPAMGRFVIVDGYEIRGGGIIRESLEDEQRQMRQQVMQRNLKWAGGTIAREQRWERYNQKAALILVTGKRNVGKKTLARAIEQRLFVDGKVVYFMGIANVLYGVDADIKKPGTDQSHRPEHVRRLAEVANILLDAGVILVVTAIGLTQKELEIIQNVVDSDLIEPIWLGEDPTDIDFAMKVPSPVIAPRRR